MNALAWRRWEKWLPPCAWGWTVPECRCVRLKSPAALANSRMVPPRPARLRWSPCGPPNLEMRRARPCGIRDQSLIRPRLKAPLLRIPAPIGLTSPSAYCAKQRGEASRKLPIAWCWAMALLGFGTPPGNCSPKLHRFSIGTTPKKLCTEPLNRSSAQPAKANHGQRRAARNSMRANCMPSSTLSVPISLPAPRPPNARCTSSTIALACVTRNFAPKVSVPPPASSRPAAKWRSVPGLSGLACTGPCVAQTPSSPCAAPSSADVTRTSGSVAGTGLSRDSLKSDVRPWRTIADPSAPVWGRITANSSPPRRADIRRPAAGFEKLGDGLEGFVPGVVPILVVQELEPVQVDHHQGNHPVTARPVDFVLQSFLEAAPVEEAGQGVGIGEVFELGVGFLQHPLVGDDIGCTLKDQSLEGFVQRLAGARIS